MSTTAEQEQRYRCACQHELQVFGRGRHRVYFGLSDTALTDPVMSRVCPDCRRLLLGKHSA